MTNRKAALRAQISSELIKVALPDSRFHYDFSSFIADFHGSSIANTHLQSHPCFQTAETVFITPDNCLEDLRLCALNAGKRVLVTTYGIRRGFWLLDPSVIRGEGDRIRAGLLDGMEKVGRHITLAEMRREGIQMDLLVTGTGAIDRRTGVRFGKGHGFFDIEWGILQTLGMISKGAKVVAMCHDCQVVDEALEAEEHDTVCDLIFTPSVVINVVAAAPKPTCGILWDRLEPGMLGDIPPLQELREMQNTMLS